VVEIVRVDVPEPPDPTEMLVGFNDPVGPPVNTGETADDKDTDPENPLLLATVILVLESEDPDETQTMLVFEAML